MAQLDEDGHLLLFDVCCLWIWVRASLQKSFNVEIISKHDDMFERGFLACMMMDGQRIGYRHRGYWHSKKNIIGRQMDLAINHGAPNGFG